MLGSMQLDTGNFGLDYRKRDSTIPYDEAHYDLLREQLTAARVKEAYGEVVKGEVRRYELPGVKALNFVMYQALDGGVSRSLALHGKSRGSIMGTIDVEVPDV